LARYRLTRKAADDVRYIYREGKRLFGEQQADAYHSHLHGVFALLAENPKLARLRQGIEPPVRIHPTGSHLVVYVDRGDAEILIVRVRHFRENWQ
jgi:toxin ParE1/3/4